jgi:rhamnosyltransferase
MLNETEKTGLTKYCDSIITRENQGYDFISWQVGLNNESLGGFDEILLCNDSVYGPLFPLEEAFDFMSTKDYDFWGMTESRQISYHLQSYFLVLRKPIILSSVFQTFWKNITIQESKTALIRAYEVGLSGALLRAGFSSGAYVGYSPPLLKRFTLMMHLCGSRVVRMMVSLRTSVAVSKTEAKSGSGEGLAHMALPVFPPRVYEKVKSVLKGENFNITHQFWKELIVHRRMPFLKVELLRDNPMKVNISDFEKVIASCSDYNIGHIKSHLMRMKKKIVTPDNHFG